ncbi:MAG: enoyl-CoA hydratase-related protein [Thermodesulfobacteriota bacterium]|nr:enoyl-CoA hydratase-related protein [Thermodesulfobacteriota bacterium]
MKKIQYDMMQENGIARITMDDNKANAMDDVFFKELQQVLDQAEKDQPKIVLIKGRPGYFSGGLHLKYMMTLSQDELVQFVTQFARAMLRIYTLPVPTVAMVTGHAIAGGAMLAFACEQRFIVRGSYTVQMNETLLGISLPSWMLLIAGEAIPLQWQSEVLLHARSYTPEEIVEKEIFNGFLEGGERMMETLLPSIEPLLAINPKAYAATKNRMRPPEAIDRVLAVLKDEIG